MGIVICPCDSPKNCSIFKINATPLGFSSKVFMKKTSMKRKFILFDFDGVIVDSFAAAFEVNKMLCPHITEDEYRRCFEGNINDYWQAPTHTEKCRQDIDFFDGYIPRLKEVKIIPEMLKIIKTFSRLYTLIIVSSTLTSPIHELIKRYHAIPYFTEIMGNDVHASKVEKIKMIFSKYSAGPNQCVFITDTLGDMRESSQTGVGSIGVSWGFQKRETLLKGNPFRIVEKPKELLTAIPAYFESARTKDRAL